MKNTSLEQKKKEFREAVANYRGIIEDGFYSRPGDEGDGNVPKKKVVRLFTESPAALKNELLCIAIRTMTRKSQPRDNPSSLHDSVESAERLTNWLRDLGDELADELERIQKRQNHDKGRKS